MYLRQEGELHYPEGGRALEQLPRQGVESLSLEILKTHLQAFVLFQYVDYVNFS